MKSDQDHRIDAYNYLCITLKCRDANYKVINLSAHNNLCFTYWIYEKIKMN